MECPYCDEELVYKDFYGHYLGRDQWDKKGEIYVCENEECEGHHFYTTPDGELHEGYPC